MSTVLKDRFMRVATNRTSTLDLSISPACAERLENIVANGVERMITGYAADKPGRVILAERNLGTFIRYMAEQARKRSKKPVVDEEIFDATLHECRPLWPFC